jgi:cyclopropane fatty-acyl-phospholipid synthase-like methyltransferase
MLSPILIGGILIFLTFLVALSLKKGIPCAIFVPTPPKIIECMLELASLKPNEILYDLGCGDGRIILMAAENYGANSIGVEVNPILAGYARLKVRKKKLESRSRVIQSNLFKVDLRKADVVTLYLSQYANNRLEGKLEKELKPGARVVSYVFNIIGWKTSAKDSKNNIFLYIVPNAYQEVEKERRCFV